MFEKVVVVTVVVVLVESAVGVVVVCVVRVVDVNFFSHDKVCGLWVAFSMPLPTSGTLQNGQLVFD